MNRFTRLALMHLSMQGLLGCAPHIGDREPISFRQDVYPILERNCFACHTPPDGVGFRKTGLNLTAYETLMKGTRYGPVIVPGDARHSILNMLVEGRADRSLRMPHASEEPLSFADIETLRVWVNQGARNN